MKIAYLGNFSAAPYTTENHVAKSLEHLGHTVLKLQEGGIPARHVADFVIGNQADIFLWTQTYGLAVSGGTIPERFHMLDAIKSAGIPTVGFHLDRWWGLDREDQLSVEPFFRVDYLFTADGAHDAEWSALGINHIYSPPAVFHVEAQSPGSYDDAWAADIAFVGSWRSYHAEWPHRLELVNYLMHRWRDRVRFFPVPNQPAVRGSQLADLYASAKVVVGDSCLAPRKDGSPMINYCSDRIFETVGRGGFLLHPHVDGVFPELMVPGAHLDTWPLHDFPEMDRRIDYYLNHEEERLMIARTGREHVLANHTYLNRLARVLDVVTFGS